jgi:hypothetical protein
MSSMPISKRFGKPEPVMDRCMDVSGGNGIADTEEPIRALSHLPSKGSLAEES